MGVMPKRNSSLLQFGRNVARHRNEAGLSQDKLAEKADLDRTCLNRTLRRAGWKVVRIWEHELARQRGKHRTTNIQHPTSNADRLVRRIQRAFGG